MKKDPTRSVDVHKIERSVLFLMVIGFAVLLSGNPVFSQNVDTLWSENFEGSWSNDWHITYGTWAVGTISSGPGNAYEGQSCAATVVDGNYGNYVDSTRLIRHTPFVVPTVSPRLRFWHWYYFQINDNDWGKAQIRISGTSKWNDLPEGVFRDRSGGWTNAFIDLSTYAGQNVEIAFLFHSNSGYTQPGWYIDEIAIESGARQVIQSEDWESGLDDWYADYGFWQVGSPSSGPGSAHEGNKCVGTILDGDYWDYVDSTRLISPPIQVPNDSPRLRFWHWYGFQINDNDWGKVQVRIAGRSNWDDLPEALFMDRSGGWTQAYIDLTAYSGEIVEFAFLFHSNSGYHQAGWYIDELWIESGVRTFNNPEDWENGFGDWYADYGFWQVGSPTSGPDSAYQGQNCVGTILDGPYWDWIDSTRLISPPVQLPAGGGVLRFFHWYSFQINDDDRGEVQIKTVGSNENWTTLANARYTDQSTVWFQTYLPLSDYASSTIQIAFLFHSNGGYHQAGWYIDSLEIIFPDLVSDDNALLADKYQLSQNYPNPFNPETHIIYNLPKTAQVRIAVFNTLGQLVAVLVDRQMPAGEHTVQFDGSGLSSGIYLYRIQAGNFTQVRKMLLVR